MSTRKLGIAALLAVASAAQANFVTNGSMTGPPGVSYIPPDWYTTIGTPDTFQADGYDAYAEGMPASPDGGTFASMAVDWNGGYLETVCQDVSLIAGHSYVLSFWYANAGTTLGTQDKDGWIAFGIGPADETTVLDHTTSTLPYEGAGHQTWHAWSYTFTAAIGGTQRLAFESLGNTGETNRMAIDGVSLGFVPSPGSACLLTVAGLMSSWRRRR